MAYDTRTVLYLTFELLVATLSVFGNALVMAAFLRDRSLRTPTNLFVFSLAVADFLTSSVATPIYAHSMLTNLPHEFRACICVHTLILTFCTVSIFHLIAVSFDRYMAVVWRRKPVPHEQGMRRATKFIACAWIFGILIGFLPLMGWNAGESWRVETVQKCEFLKVISTSYLVFLFYGTIIAPTIVMTFFYGSIYYVVRKQNARMLNSRYSLDSRASVSSDATNRLSFYKDPRRRATTDSGAFIIRDQSIDIVVNSINQNRSASVPILPARATALQKKQHAKTKKVIFSLLLVIICFFISWYPLYIMNTVVYYCETCQFESWWFFAPIILSHLSSVLNPFIYARTMPGYREAFVEILTCGKIIAKPAGSLKTRRSGFSSDVNARKRQSSLSRKQTFDNGGDAFI